MMQILKTIKKMGDGALRDSAHLASESSAQDRRGMILLLVVVLASAMLSIGIELFHVIAGETLISGEITDSFMAFYAADEGIERVLYLDRDLNLGPVADGFHLEDTATSQACYSADVDKGVETEVVANGQYRCGSGLVRSVVRAFEVRY